MITRASSFLDRRSAESRSVDRMRGVTIVLLSKHNMPIEDIAMALNCSESVVRSLLAGQYLSVRPLAGSNIASCTDAISVRMAVHADEADNNDHRQLTVDEIAVERGRCSRLLSLEVRRWLCTFEVSDADCQYVIEQAGFLLDKSFLNEDGNLSFGVTAAFLEVLGIWGRHALSSHSPDFRTRLSPWLACCIRFWITDPAIWNLALDREYTYFGDRSLAA